MERFIAMNRSFNTKLLGSRSKKEVGLANLSQKVMTSFGFRKGTPYEVDG